MATPPVFSAGAVLTASQMNAVGLWLVAEVNQTSQAATIPVSNCFSADFDNYRVVVTNVASNGDNGMWLRFGGLTTGHYGWMHYTEWTGGTGGAGSNNATAMYIGLTETNNASGQHSFDVLNPYKSGFYTSAHGTWYARGYQGWFGGTQIATSSITGFALLSDSAGKTVSGTVRVYGYRD